MIFNSDVRLPRRLSAAVRARPHPDTGEKRMKRILLSALTAALMFSASEASAFTSTGYVLAVIGNEFWIWGGDVYQLPHDQDLSWIRIGQRVNVTWSMQTPGTIDLNNDDYVNLLHASRVTPAQ